MSGFSNAVVGGSGILKRKAIQSVNYVLGTAGWTINADGSAEFNNLSIRGSFFGSRFILNSNGIYFYSGTPALGNMIMCWTSTGAADPFGNTPTQAGLVIGGSAGTQVGLSTNAGAALITFLLNNATYTNPTLQAVLVPFAQLLVGGPKNTTVGGTDSVFFELNAGGNTGGANGTFIYSDLSSGSHFQISWGAGGVTITPCANITGVHPGTGTPATPAVSETWQTPALLNNWQVGGPIPGGVRYAFNPINGGRIDVEWDVFNNVVALPATSTIAQLSAPYLALVNGTQFRRNMASMNNYNFANNSPSAAWFWYDGAGNFQCINYETHAEFAGQGFIPLT